MGTFDLESVQLNGSFKLELSFYAFKEHESEIEEH